MVLCNLVLMIFFLWWGFSQIFKDCTGFFLKIENSNVYVHDADKKLIYRLVVKILNKDKLNKRIDTPWRARLGLIDGGWTWMESACINLHCWRKLLIAVEDLHSAVAVNAFISVLNSDINHDCPFLLLFVRQFFTVLWTVVVFCHCSQCWKMFLNCLKWFFFPNSCLFWVVGIPKEGERAMSTFQLHFGRAKMAVYMSRRNKVEGIHRW